MKTVAYGSCDRLWVGHLRGEYPWVLAPSLASSLRKEPVRLDGLVTVRVVFHFGFASVEGVGDNRLVTRSFALQRCWDAG